MKIKQDSPKSLFYVENNAGFIITRLANFSFDLDFYKSKRLSLFRMHISWLPLYKKFIIEINGRTFMKEIEGEN